MHCPFKVHHFIPLAPWTCNKIKGKKRVMNMDNRNDGPSSKYEKKEQIKLVLDMSNDGPMFKMLESMLRKANRVAEHFDKQIGKQGCRNFRK
jgi:hypothetical protein